jgi:polysaccharide deacetylase family protein (PEP-CTERM system associated)
MDRSQPEETSSLAIRDLLKARPDFMLEDVPVGPRLNALTVDVECWEHIIRQDLTNEYQPPCRECYEKTEYLLDMFDDAGVKATFFVLGVFGESFPELVRKMDSRGHEIAVHGHTHRQLFNLTAGQFKEDLAKAVKLLSDIIGKPIIGYRAPAFSLDGRSPWALDILAEQGIQYDSSIFPFSGRRYGMPAFPGRVVRIRWLGGRIIEVPLSTVVIAGKRFPVAGGGYFRLLPRFVIRWAVDRINRDGDPFVTYVHPYEFGTQDMRFGQFCPPMSKLQAAFQQVRFNLFRRTMKSKLVELLRAFPFATMKEVIKDGLKD